MGTITSYTKSRIDELLGGKASSAQGTKADSALQPGAIDTLLSDYLTWYPMTTAVPDQAGSKHRFTRVLTANETLNVADGVDGQTILIKYTASGANRTLTLGINMALSNELTDIPTILTTAGILLTFIFSTNQSKWICISYVSGV